MATALTATDIFQFYEKSGAKMSERMKAILVNPNAATILNENWKIRSIDLALLSKSLSH